MSRVLNRYATALPLVAIVVTAAALAMGPERTQAHHLCANTGSPLGPFDLQTYEAADYRNVYARSMELAGFNQLFPEHGTFQLPGIEGVQPSPYIPPVLLKSIAWLESGWAQGSYDPLVQYGEVGPVLSSHDCGYGIMQITSGMQNVTGVPSLDQAMIGGHYAFNIARGARILADKWNLSPEYRPVVGSRNSQIVEDWYYAIWGYNGFAFKNHPLNPDYAWPRSVYDCSSARTYPYQELVLGCAQNPPWRGGSPLWGSQPVQLPNLSDPAFAGPLSVGNWNQCSFNLQCGAMNIPTPNPWHVDPTTPPFNRSQVIGDPALNISTSSLNLAAPPGGQSAAQTVTVTNAGSGVLAWRALPSAGWLRVSRLQGVSLGANLGRRDEVFSVHADASSLPPGTHSAQVAVESLYAGGAPRVINVTLRTSSSPAMHVDAPMPGIVREPFNVSGWAIDRAATAGTGVSTVHVWAYPAHANGSITGAPPQFLGPAQYGFSRPDVGLVYGSQFTNSGFNLTVNGLSTGFYRLIVYARGPLSDAPFEDHRVIRVPPMLMAMDSPGPQAQVREPFDITGWAIDGASASSPAVNYVHIYAYPSDSSGRVFGGPIFLGAANRGLPRPDIAAIYGGQFQNSGYSLSASGLSGGFYHLVAYARSSISASVIEAHRVIQVPPMGIALDVPLPNAMAHQPFDIAGWALDGASASSPGVGYVHAYAYPSDSFGNVTGGPIFLGAATLGLPRPDVAVVYGGQFHDAGYALSAGGLSSGYYHLVVYARSSISPTVIEAHRVVFVQ